MIYVLIFVFGAVIGSFLNVLIIRVNTGESLVWRGSRCLSCSKKLKWFELIPIASFFIQGGRCAKCKSKISWQYPIVEIITGLLFLLIFNFKFFPPEADQPLAEIFKLLYFWTIFALLLAISVYDARRQIIPDLFVYPFIVLSSFSVFFEFSHLDFIWNLGFGFWDFITRISVGLGMFAFFGLLWLASRGRWMGFGDAKLALGAGWLLGLENGILAVLLSFWLGAVFAVFLLLFRRKDFTLKSRIPFGPFLAFGIAAAFFFGGNIWNFYFNFFNLI